MVVEIIHLTRFFWAFPGHHPAKNRQCSQTSASNFPDEEGPLSRNLYQLNLARGLSEMGYTEKRYQHHCFITILPYITHEKTP
jgi:hypothetical protein